MRLESYEDTLENIEISRRSDLFSVDEAFAEDYRLRYALKVETAGSASLFGKRFTNPFAYELEITRDSRSIPVTVDLEETFNFLLGLRVESRRRIDKVLATVGIDPEGNRCLVIWRNTEDTDNQALERWFERNRDVFGAPLNKIYVNGDQTLNAIRTNNESWMQRR